MPTFTLKEFIEKNKLEVNLQDSPATKMITKKLRESGYQQVRLLHNGLRQMVWTNERLRELSTLESKLKKLQL